jgi:hypothetical protein
MLHLLGIVLLLLLRLLLGFLLLLLLLVLLVLFVPFQYDFRGHRCEEDTAATGAVHWLYRLVSLVAAHDMVQGFQLRLMLFEHWGLKSFGRSGAVKARKKTDKEKQPPKKDGHKFVLTREKALLIANATIRVLKRISPRWFQLEARIGFDDPADTGSLCAVLATLQAFVHTNPDRYKVHVLPVFEEAEASGHMELQGRLMLWFIVWEGLKLAISKPFRQDIFPFLKPHAQRHTKQRNTTIQGGYEHV